LEVLGLYRSPSLKRRLESVLSAHGGITRIEVNLTTGRVLVRFGDETTLQRIVAAIEVGLGPVAVSDGTDRLGVGRPRPVYALSHALSGFAALLRGAGAHFSSLPALAAWPVRHRPHSSGSGSCKRFAPGLRWI
jgi:hypothetical protein